nr:MAG TPA: hypothetical protein [Caudoviricetes sp.]
MPLTLPSGIVVPVDTEQFDPSGDMRRMGRTTPTIKACASLMEAQEYVLALRREGTPVQPATPAFVWRTDLEELHVCTGIQWTHLPSQSDISYMLTPSAGWDCGFEEGVRTGRVCTAIMRLTLTEPWTVDDTRTYVAGTIPSELSSSWGWRGLFPTAGPNIYVDVQGTEVKIMSVKTAIMEAGRHWVGLVWHTRPRA